MSDPCTSSATKPSHWPRLTRGEKCLLVHILVTTVLIIGLVVLIVVHAIFFDHNIFLNSMRRRGSDKAETISRDGSSLQAVIFVRAQVACSGSVLARNWLIVPARCVLVRAHPALADLLPDWIAKVSVYRNDSNRVEMNLDADGSSRSITRGLLHPDYEVLSGEHDLGLFKVFEPFSWPDFIEPTPLAKDSEFYGEGFIIGWIMKNSAQTTAACSKGALVVRVRAGGACKRWAARVLPLNERQFCLSESSFCPIVPGAALLVDGRLVGMLSRGDGSSQSTPFVFLYVDPYRRWITESILEKSS